MPSIRPGLQWQVVPQANRQIGKGDISGSYSADRIGMGKPVRKPFLWKGAPHVCVGMRYHGETMAAEAYRLVPLRLFDGEANDLCRKAQTTRRAPIRWASTTA